MDYSTKRTVLLVGATGHLGGKVARIAAQRGWRLRALIRATTDAAQVAALGAEVVRGDLLDPASLQLAMNGCQAVIATAIGYANRRKGDLTGPTDTLGNRNLADVALTTGVARVVFCSVLTCDRAQQVPHFWHKKLAEDYFEQKNVPFVALRPGAFLDQGPGDFWARGLETGRLRFASNPNVPATFVHTQDVARYLVAAVELPAEERALRVDIGCDRPVSIADLAELMGSILERPIRAQIPPWPIVSAGLAVAGLFDPWKRDLRAMMKYFQQGGYVADVAQQRKYFGEPPSIAASVRRYLADAGLLQLQRSSPDNTEQDREAER
jgi:uncharacterized protein YbjT (DUF2867 family)